MPKAILISAILGAGLLAFWSVHASSQAIDTNACERACYEDQTACIEDCGDHSNPVECEAECHDELRDCLRECR